MQYNMKLIQDMKLVGDADIKKELKQFESTLNAYAEHALDWESNKQNILADADDSASRAAANQALASYDRIRSQYHNELIQQTVQLDRFFVKETGKRLCTFPIKHSAVELKNKPYRDDIAYAAFTYYANTHPNERQDDPIIKGVRKDYLNQPKEEFRTDIAQMRDEFNDLPLPYKAVAYHGRVIFLDERRESTLKIYSPFECALKLHEDRYLLDPKQQATALATLTYADLTNGQTPHLAGVIHSNVSDLLEIDNLDIKQVAQQHMYEWAKDPNNDRPMEINFNYDAPQQAKTQML